MKKHTIDNEPELLQRVASGDHAAFRLLFDHYRNRVYAIGLKLLKSETLAEDTVQEVFLKLWTAKENLPQINDFSAYLNTLTRYHLLNQLKRLAHAEKFVSEQKKAIMQQPHIPSETLERNELQARLSMAVNRLSPQQKRVYLLGKKEGLSYEEIAGQLQISRETVKTHMSEALRSVKSFLLQQDSTQNRFLLLVVLLAKIFF